MTTYAGALPPLQLTAMTFAVAFVLALGKWRWRRGPMLRHLRLPFRVWLLGVGGLFGYHALYFAAFRLAPPVEANLLNYLWPLLIVLFSAVLPGEHLRARHIVGALFGFSGAFLLIGGFHFSFRSAYALGYTLAFACALTWSGYSVLSRLFPAVSSDSVGGFCGATALLALIGHLLFEQTVWPGTSAVLAIVIMGIGPVGAAFFFWDHGMKRGDIRALGTLAYMTPLLSTLLLVAAGRADPSVTLFIAMGLIVAGAALGAGGFLPSRRRRERQIDQ